jgi:exoribonuclease R
MKQVVLIENDINTRPFSTQVLACLPSLPWTLSPEDLANPNRQDLRQVRVFSVDPPGEFTMISVPFSSVFGLTEYHPIAI